MEASVEGHNSHGLVETGLRHNGLLADTTARRELLVEVVDAVDLVSRVHCEGDPVERFVADDACEAGWVVRLPSGAEDAVQDRLRAHATLLKSVLHTYVIYRVTCCYKTISICSYNNNIP